jgi:hypothetical protein
LRTPIRDGSGTVPEGPIEIDYIRNPLAPLRLEELGVQETVQTLHLDSAWPNFDEQNVSAINLRDEFRAADFALA